MTIMALPEHLRNIEWGEPQEIEVRIGGELVLLGLAVGIGMQRIERSCANPECESGCIPAETLQLEIDIAPPIEEEPHV